MGSPRPWLTVGVHPMIAEMNQWMTDKGKTWPQDLHPVCLLPYHQHSPPGFPSLLKSPLEKLEDTPRQLHGIASHLLWSFCIPLIYVLAFLHGDLSLFGVLLLPSCIIHSESSWPLPPLVLANSHPQNTGLIHLTKICLSTQDGPGTAFMALRGKSAYVNPVTTPGRTCWTWKTKRGSALLLQWVRCWQEEGTLAIGQGTGKPGLLTLLNHELPASIIFIVLLCWLLYISTHPLTIPLRKVPLCSLFSHFLGQIPWTNPTAVKTSSQQAGDFQMPKYCWNDPFLWWHFLILTGKLLCMPFPP